MIQHATNDVGIFDVPKVVADGPPAILVVIDLHTADAGVSGVRVSSETNFQKHS